MHPLSKVEHHLCILEVSAGLHLLTKIYSTSRSYFGHLEHKHLIFFIALIKKTSSFGHNTSVESPQQGDTFLPTKSPKALENDDTLSEARKAHIFAPVQYTPPLFESESLPGEL